MKRPTKGYPTDDEMEQALIMWNHNRLAHTTYTDLKEADFILTLGSPDTLPAETAADLNLRGWAPRMVFSGKGGRNTEKLPLGKVGMTEARMLAEVAAKKIGSWDNIFLEEEARYTAENITKTRELLARKGIHPNIGIFVHMPSSLCRDYSITMKEWAGIEVVMACPDVPLEKYHETGFQGQMTQCMLISDMLGDTQRWAIYPWRIEDEIPDDILNSFEYLADRGYDEHLKKHSGRIINIRDWAKNRCPEDFYK